jgi:hypothetical protein
MVFWVELGLIDFEYRYGQLEPIPILFYGSREKFIELDYYKGYSNLHTNKGENKMYRRKQKK